MDSRAPARALVLVEMLTSGSNPAGGWCSAVKTINFGRASLFEQLDSCRITSREPTGPFQIIPYGTWEMSSGWTQTEQGMVKDERVALSFNFKSTDRVQSKLGLGTILGAFRSLNDGVTQYQIETENGTKLYEFEEDLSLVARATQQSGVFAGKWACVSSDMPAFVHLPGNKLESIMRLSQDGTKVSGIVESVGGGSQVSFLVPNENSVEFDMDTAFGKGRISCEAPEWRTYRQMAAGRFR